MRKTTIGGLAALIAIAFLGTLPACGGGGSQPTPTPTPDPVSVNAIDGEADVAVDSSFKYTFTNPVTVGTVTADSYFIVPTPAAAAQVVGKAAVDPAVCDPEAGLDASRDCSSGGLGSSSSCTLTPSASLNAGTGYTICLTGDITYTDGTSFEGFQASFTTTGSSLPTAPANVSATKGDTRATISWDAVTGATSYNIYWKTSAGVTKSDTKIEGQTSPYIHTGLTNGTTYYYAVTAENAAGEGELSSEVSATPQVAIPSAPTGVSATAGDAQNTVAWSAVTDATSYNIYWKTSAGVTTSDTKIEGATTPYTHTGLTNDTAYYYAMTAVNAAGESALSSEVSATPQLAVPGVPANVSATQASESVTVAWDAVTGADSYNIYWAKAAGVTPDTGTKIASATSPYLHAQDGAQAWLTAGTTYYYVVTAVNAAGEGTASSQVSVAAGNPILRAFVTSTDTHTGNLGGLAGADTICQTLAAASTKEEVRRHSEDFKAWMSDGTDDAYCRISGFSGKIAAFCGQGEPFDSDAGPWLRTDGKPFAGKLDDMLSTGSDEVYLPLRYDETGTEVEEDLIDAYTGTESSGELATFMAIDRDCEDWTNATPGDDYVGIGNLQATAQTWTRYNIGASCGVARRLICMQTGEGWPLQPFAEEGKKVFVTSTTHAGDLGDFAGADDICDNLGKSAFGAEKSFNAWISTLDLDAKDHISDVGPWVRFDGIKVADNLTDLTTDNLYAPINQTEEGDYVVGNAWTGTEDDGTHDAGGNFCDYWEDPTDGSSGRRGIVNYTRNAGSGASWTYSDPNFCNTELRLYCFEQ